MRKIDNKGITLVEIMVTSTLGLLLIATMVGILTLGREVWQDTETKMATLQEARKGLSEIALDLPRSSRRPTAEEGPPADVRVAGDGSWIRFYIPQSIATNGVITWGDEIRYQLGGTGNQLIREDLTTGETQVVANFIDNATFGPLTVNSNLVPVTVSSQKTSLTTRSFSTQLSTNITVRN